MSLPQPSASSYPAVSYASHIEEIWQYPELPAGCEPVSLTCVLRSFGFNVGLTEIADDYLAYDEEGDFVYGYVGSPYDTGGGFPPALVDAANAYLATQNSSARAHNLTGASFAEVLAWVEKGYPVMVWSTMYMDEPWYNGETIDESEWYSNEHCVVLYGIGEDGAYVSDPLEGLVVRNAEEFKDLYEACGSMALVIA